MLRLWEGLGYYRRARQMHRAARQVVAEHGGQFPRTLEEVARLPGIGRYTAGAIVSIAYDQPAPILEANTVRLLSRLVAFAGVGSVTATHKALWQLAEAIVPSRNCGAFNQALMELGSLVCTPRSPNCDACPVRGLCRRERAGSAATDSGAAVQTCRRSGPRGVGGRRGARAKSSSAAARKASVGPACGILCDFRSPRSAAQRSSENSPQRFASKPGFRSARPNTSPRSSTASHAFASRSSAMLPLAAARRSTCRTANGNGLRRQNSEKSR